MDWLRSTWSCGWLVNPGLHVARVASGVGPSTACPLVHLTRNGSRSLEQCHRTSSARGSETLAWHRQELTLVRLVKRTWALE